jgi:hypothetical protein
MRSHNRFTKLGCRETKTEKKKKKTRRNSKKKKVKVIHLIDEFSSHIKSLKHQETQLFQN